MFLPPDRSETDEMQPGMINPSRGDSSPILVLSDLVEPSDAVHGLLGWGYDRDLIRSVWDFAEIVPGNDPSLWRKDEFGSWIHRPDYARRSSEFGWEIFDPGIGRHAQGVFAMRPMQWESYLRLYDTFV